MKFDGEKTVNMTEWKLSNENYRYIEKTGKHTRKK